MMSQVSDNEGWPLTIHRREAGERLDVPDDLRLRCRGYRRARDARDLAAYLKMHPAASVVVALHIDATWLQPSKGVIPPPSPIDVRSLPTHGIQLVGVTDRESFRFVNSWGREWGSEGTGELPFSHVDHHMIEAWLVYGEGMLTPEFEKSQREADHVLRRWVVRDECDRRLYGFEIWDTAECERCAWAFVPEMADALEIEELYVRPEYRLHGMGRILATRVRELADAKHARLRSWVPFADAAREQPGNRAALMAIVRRLGLRFRPCPMPWAAYLAEEGAGADEPIEPTFFPPRPQATLASLSAAMALSMPVATPPSGPPALPATIASIPASDSQEWRDLNRRRVELIRKKVREGLSDFEESEFERLQEISIEIGRRVMPEPLLTQEILDALEARLKGTAGNPNP
jgi:GNAT superfamily N-acetyltransferase